MLLNLIGGFVIILVGISMMPYISNMMTSAEAQNVSSAASTMFDIVPLFFVIGIATAGIGIIYTGLKAVGIIGNVSLPQEAQKKYGIVTYSDSSDLPIENTPKVNPQSVPVPKFNENYFSRSKYD